MPPSALRRCGLDTQPRAQSVARRVTPSLSGWRKRCPYTLSECYKTGSPPATNFSNFYFLNSAVVAGPAPPRASYRTSYLSDEQVRLESLRQIYLVLRKALTTLLP